MFKGYRYTHTPDKLLLKYANTVMSPEELDTSTGQILSVELLKISGIEYNILEQTEKARRILDDIDRCVMANPDEEFRGMYMVDNLSALLRKHKEAVRLVRMLSHIIKKRGVFDA